MLILLLLPRAPPSTRDAPTQDLSGLAENVHIEYSSNVLPRKRPDANSCEGDTECSGEDEDPSEDGDSDGDFVGVEGANCDEGDDGVVVEVREEGNPFIVALALEVAIDFGDEDDDDDAVTVWTLPRSVIGRVADLGGATENVEGGGE
jgi:hypothetical protein